MKLAPNWKRLAILPALTLGFYGGMGLASYQGTGPSLPAGILPPSGPMPLELSLIQKVAALASPDQFHSGLLRGIDAAYSDVYGRDPINTTPIVNADQLAGFNAGFACFTDAAQAVRAQDYSGTAVVALRDPEARVKTQAIHLHSQCTKRALATGRMILPSALTRL